MQQVRVHITMQSGNAKTGPIPVSTTEAPTCPPACPFNTANQGGCYAAGGPLAIHWRKVTAGAAGGSWDDLCHTVAGMPEAQLWRHNQAGDLPGIGDAIDAPALRRLVKANAGKRGFTYTHKPVTGPHGARNGKAIAAANAGGFTVNLSANNLAHADDLAARELGPVVAVLPADVDGKVTKTLATPAGRTVVICPATYRDDVNCASCGLCQRQRSTIVGFPAHGAAKRKASAIASR